MKQIFIKLIPIIWGKLPRKARLVLASITFIILLATGGIKHELVIDTFAGWFSAEFEKINGSDNEEFIGSDGKHFEMRF